MSTAQPFIHAMAAWLSDCLSSWVLPQHAMNVRLLANVMPLNESFNSSS